MQWPPRVLPAVALLLATASASPAQQQARFRDPVFAAVDVTRDIAYGSALNRWTNRQEVLYLDRYLPRGDTATARPALIVVHGGGFHGGDKGGRFASIATDFAKLGYVAVSINYRLKPRTVPITRQVVTDAMHDFKAAVRCLRKNASAWRIDPNRIASLGSSAGAITALEAAYVPGDGASGNPGWPSHHDVVIDLWGLLWDEKEMEKGEPPVFILHGTADPTVPYARAQSLVARAKAVGVPYELHPLQGAGHAPWNLYPAKVPDIIAFLWEHLELAKLSGLGARPGYTSPGRLDIDHFGVAGDITLLLLSDKKVAIDLGRLGVLCPDPATLVVPQIVALPATPRLPTAAFGTPVPGGLQGLTFHWQALHVVAAPSPALRTLTNCVDTRF